MMKTHFLTTGYKTNQGTNIFYYLLIYFLQQIQYYLDHDCALASWMHKSLGETTPHGYHLWIF